MSQTGNDGVSLPLSSEQSVARDTLRLNDAIDDDIFTLAPPPGVSYFDFDQERRSENNTSRLLQTAGCGDWRG